MGKLEGEASLRHWLRAAMAWSALFVMSWAAAACLSPDLARAHPVLELGLQALGLFLLVTSTIAFVVDQGSRAWSEKALAAFVLGGFATAFAAARWGGGSVPAAVLKGLALSTLAFALGRLLVNRVERAWWLLALLSVGLLADLWSVFSQAGVSRKLVTGDSFILKVVLLAWPLKAGGGVRGVIGVADFVFFALFVLSARKFGFASGRTIPVLALAMLGTLGAVGFFGIPLPVVPALAVAFVLLHGRDCLGSAMLSPREDRSDSGA